MRARIDYCSPHDTMRKDVSEAANVLRRQRPPGTERQADLSPESHLRTAVLTERSDESHRTGTGEGRDTSTVQRVLHTHKEGGER